MLSPEQRREKMKAVIRAGSGNFLELPLKEIEKRKNDSAFCRSCKDMGAHVYVLYLRNWKDRMKSRMAHLYCGIRRHSV